MKAPSRGKGYGPVRLKTAILAAIDERVRVCRLAEERYTVMACEQNGGVLGSVELATQAVATERSARMEAELIRAFVASLPVRGEPVA
jgi:hypothetical protein